MDAPLVSVIIPVYKAERFLDECVESVIGQDWPALEIILIDDGSPDSCPEICDQYARTHGFIRVIHQSNQGPGPARNAGLEAATGKYIAFVDSDDCLDGTDAIRRMAEAAERDRADIAVGLFRRFRGRWSGEARHGGILDAGRTGTVDFRFRAFVMYGLHDMVSASGKLYRRSFLAGNGLKFRDYPFGEDRMFNMMCCAHEPAYSFVDGSVYLYRDNGDSLTHRYWGDLISVHMAIARDFESFLSERGILEEYGDLIAFHVCVGLVTLAYQELAYNGLPSAVKSLSRYGRDPLVRETVKEIVRGRHIGGIKSKIWKLMLWGEAFLCRVHAYGLLALGIWVLKKAKVDERL